MRHVKAGTHRIPGEHTVAAISPYSLAAVFAKQDRRVEGRWAVTGCLGTLDDGEEQEVAWEDHGLEKQQIEIPWEIWVSISVSGKGTACNAGDTGSVPGWGRSPGEENSNPLHGLENSMDRGAWQAVVHGVAKGQTRLSD